MKILLITVAGTSSRFEKSLGRPCLKCLYFPHRFEQSLLYGLLHKDDAFDRYVIVGGYRFDQLQEAVGAHCKDMADKIDLLYNDKYAEYGSGYSLYVGLRHILGLGSCEVVFAEGDLFVDEESFRRVSAAECDAITYTKEPIESNRSVAFYFDRDRCAHYIYDTAHNLLEIKEPFSSIYDSGQIWKFCDSARIKTAFDRLGEADWHATNLAFIQSYFGNRKREEYCMIGFRRWINCNTVDDFNRIEGELQ